MSSSPPAAGGPALHQRLSMMLALALSVFAGAMSIRILDAMLPEIARHFSATIGAAGATVTAYAVSYSLLQAFYGPLGDRLGPCPVITAAALCSCIMALGCALASSLEWLVTLRFLAGGVAAAIGPLALAWIGHATGPQARPVAVARITGASIIGTTAGQAGGGILGAALSWRAGFVAVGILFLAAALVLLVIRKTAPDLYALGRTTESSDQAASQHSLLALARRPAILPVLIGVGLEGFAMFMSFVYISAFLERHMRLTMAEAGVLIALFGLGGVSFALAAGLITRRLTERVRAFAGGLVLAAGFIALICSGTIIVTGAALFLMGLGFFTFHNILQVRAIQMAPDRPGAAVSLFATTFFLAQAAGAWIGGWMFDNAGPTVLFLGSAAILGGLGLATGVRIGLGGADAQNEG